ncbi:tetratricopeptide repeat protein [Candidatus Peribacteria bacterium]|nr:tetratricopeptide repeat protein [Candidatus Peribacteria bacterium]
MKASARLLIPMIAAVLLAGGVLGYAWWELNLTQETLRQRVQSLIGHEDEKATGSGVSLGTEAFDSSDVVLVRLRQGDLLALQGDWAGAEKEYQVSYDAGGGVPALRKLASSQIQRREIDKVKISIQELRRLGVKGEDLLLLETIVALRTGELLRAEQMLAAAQDSPQKHYGQSLLSIIRGKHDDAQKELRATQAGWDPTLRSYARALQAAYDEFALFPESKPIHLTALLGRALAQVQECELALPLLAQVVTEQDDYRDAWTVQGYCELTTERVPEALSSFERAYAIDPEKPEIQYFLGRTYIALAQWKNAATFLQYALVNGFDPEKEVRSRLAVAAEKSDDIALALEQYRALIAEPDADITVFTRAVTLAIQSDKKEDAYQLASTAARKWPDMAKAQELLGWSAAETGRDGEARAALEKALKIDPNLKSARDRLNKL